MFWELRTPLSVILSKITYDFSEIFSLYNRPNIYLKNKTKNDENKLISSREIDSFRRPVGKFAEAFRQTANVSFRSFK